MRLVSVLLLSVAALLGSACVSTSPPAQSDIASVRANRAAVVLLRVAVTSNGGPVAPFDAALASQCVAVGIGRPGDDALATVDDLTSFTDGTLADGWIYLVLPPGGHLVAFNPPSIYDPRSDAERWEDAAHWRFVVPPNTPVVYAGTMQLHCRVEPSDFGGLRIREIRAMKRHDESEAAAALAAEHLPDLPAPVTVPLERQYARESSILGGTR